MGLGCLPWVCPVPLGIASYACNVHIHASTHILGHMHVHTHTRTRASAHIRGGYKKVTVTWRGSPQRAKKLPSRAKNGFRRRLACQLYRWLHHQAMLQPGKIVVCAWCLGSAWPLRFELPASAKGGSTRLYCLTPTAGRWERQTAGPEGFSCSVVVTARLCDTVTVAPPHTSQTLATTHLFPAVCAYHSDNVI